MLLRIVFPTAIRQMDDRTSFVQEVPRDLQFSHDFGHLCRGKRIQTSGHSDLGILSNLGESSHFTQVQADTACAACPSQPGNLAITSMIFCSSHLGRKRALFGKNCVGSWIVFDNVTPGARLCLCNSVALVLTPHFLRRDRSNSVAKWTFFLSLCASRITSFLLLNFSPSASLESSKASSIPCPRLPLHP